MQARRNTYSIHGLPVRPVFPLTTLEIAFGFVLGQDEGARPPEVDPSVSLVAGVG